MKRLQVAKSSSGFFEWTVANKGIAAWCFVILVLVLGAWETPGIGAADDLFNSTNLLRISVEIPAAGIQTLRSSRPFRTGGGKPRANATVVEGATVYTNVAVQLKGFTTFQPVDGMPSLTLKFRRTQPFHGLGKISLNNSLQDPSFMHEKLAREIFAAAGVPVARAGHAIVRLNGRELGLYVLVEGLDKQFLGRYFKNPDGNLYEGGVLQDIDRPMSIVSGNKNGDDPLLQRLISASHEADPAKRFQALKGAVDLDRFIAMVAVETLLCHSDSYSMNHNNYRFYHDPSAEKIVFIPHGMDRILGTHRSGLDLPMVVPRLGMVARALLSTEEGRRLYVERAGILFTNLFRPEELCRRVRRIDVAIAAERARRPARVPFYVEPANPGLREGAAHDGDDLCRRIAQRAAELSAQFSDVPALLALTSAAVFDSSGLAALKDWRVRARAGQSQVSCGMELRDGKRVLRIRSGDRPIQISIHSRVLLPAGNFDLSGEVHVESGAGTTNSAVVSVVRYPVGRFNVDRTRMNGRALAYQFRVLPPAAPEEIEILCELRSDSRELVFDPSEVRLVHLEQGVGRVVTH